MTGAWVDRSGIHFAGGDVLPASMDVLLEGHRVCSVDPARSRTAQDGTRWLPWPAGLVGFLEGSAHIVLREHVSGRVVMDEDVVLSPAAGRVSVVDAEGHPLAFDKWGQPGRAFENADAESGTRLATAAAALLREVDDILGVPSFVAYGTLLGAVRTGHLIGHDFDADIAYLGNGWHPADVAHTSFRLQRSLAERGWDTHRPCDSMYQVRASSPGRADLPYIDIFPAYRHDGVFEIPPLCRGALEPEQLTPLREVELEGVALPAPADSEAVLACTYGPRWRTPDPAFRFEMSEDYERRMHGWMGNHVARPGRWRRWYREGPGSTESPSDFASWVVERLAPGTSVLDVCCGAGADTLALARHTGHAVGVDFATEALEAAVTAASGPSTAGPAPEVEFHDVTVYDLRALLARTLGVAVRPGPKALYSRLGIDALGDSGRANLLLACRTLLRGGGRSYFEVRLRRGNPFPRARRAPWNAVVDVDLLLDEIAARGGTIEEQETVPGPEPERGASTSLLRLVARW